MPKRFLLTALGLTLFAALATGLPVSAQTNKSAKKPQRSSGSVLLVEEELKSFDLVYEPSKGYYKDYLVDLTKGKKYVITETTTRFSPALFLEDLDGKSVQQGYNYGRSAYVIFTPPKTAKYLVVASSRGRAYGKFTLAVREYTAPKVILTKEGTIKRTDPGYNRRRGHYHHVHNVKLKAGQVYTINMTSGYDNYLFLEDAAKSLLKSDDDGGTGANARIVFTPRKTASYRIITTTYSRGQTGAYQLKVVEGNDLQFNGRILRPGVPLPPGVLLPPRIQR
ncbi:MAG: hypothetical protein ACFCD0_03255 [Gemmataceae bacterium]